MSTLSRFLGKSKIPLGLAFTVGGSTARAPYFTSSQDFLTTGAAVAYDPAFHSPLIEEAPWLLAYDLNKAYTFGFTVRPTTLVVHSPTTLFAVESTTLVVKKASSPDGPWTSTATTLASTDNYLVGYLNGYALVYVSSGGSVGWLRSSNDEFASMTSIDMGFTSDPTLLNFNIAYASSLNTWVAAGFAGELRYLVNASPTGGAYGACSGEGGNVLRVLASSSVFIAHGVNASGMSRSTDGINYSNITGTVGGINLGSATVYGGVYTGTHFVIFLADGYLRSADGLTWTYTNYIFDWPNTNAPGSFFCNGAGFILAITNTTTPYAVGIYSVDHGVSWAAITMAWVKGNDGAQNTGAQMAGGNIASDLGGSLVNYGLPSTIVNEAYDYVQAWSGPTLAPNQLVRIR